MGKGERTYLGQDELVKKNMLLHVADSDGSHDQQTAKHKALHPGFENQTTWVGGPSSVGHGVCINVVRHSHLFKTVDESEVVEEGKAKCKETVYRVALRLQTGFNPPKKKKKKKAH